MRHTLAAVDVIQEKKEEVGLLVFATGTEFTLNTLLKRMHAVGASLFDLAIQSFSEDVREAVLLREREMDRLYTLSLRSAGFERVAGTSGFGILVAKGFESIADKISQYALDKPLFGKNALIKVRDLYAKAAEQYLEKGRQELQVQQGFDALKSELEMVRAKSALEWSRLESAAKHCIEIEEATEDLRAFEVSEKEA
ncbi:MAG TPA: hypothetical protein VI874_01530 [Candidatus Norongarragalinales archaeon]|nr:hypothetical protein [Candidatus Norongarragalinales archaeon]